MYRTAFAFLLCFALSGVAKAETANVAVAANFRPAMETLEIIFERSSGHQLRISYGSTGQIFAQIRHGAPFDLFLAADTERPKKLAGTFRNARPPAPYALGRLALWSPRPDPIDVMTLKQTELRFIAIANEDLAPYGAAAKAVIGALGLTEALSNKLVRGGNVAQAFVFTQTGNADLGFVALSQILSLPVGMQGTYWLPPPTLYPPIQQDALLLERGENNEAALAFFEFLLGDDARNIIRDAGYSLP